MNKKEQDIQRLLEAMNKKLERAGYTCDFPFFNSENPLVSSIIGGLLSGIIK